MTHNISGTSINAHQHIHKIFREIENIFAKIYPLHSYGHLSEKISPYWLSRLEEIRQIKNKAPAKESPYQADDPLSRIEQKTVVIAYADSVSQKNEPSLLTLETFLKTCFPAIKGLHILPACEISDERFNDGGFSQVSRTHVHERYGSNKQFEHLVDAHFSMTDFVLNHVDIDNEKFQAYLKGDDSCGRCFFIFSETEYRARLAQGDFDSIFRPRPFPLFTIFRRTPEGIFSKMPHRDKLAELNLRFKKDRLFPLPKSILNILTIFRKIKNDQMLLENDYQYIENFLLFLERSTSMDLEKIFTVSGTQESQDTPYIFTPEIRTSASLLEIILPEIGIPSEKAKAYAAIYKQADTELFGEPVRALTTFSHVQVDLNLSTFEGLKLLIDDFSWYLTMNLNMLRLDAANFAFKKWGTSCFGLPETGSLLKILYLSMEAVAPEMVPNLEVNAPLSTILKQMADKEAPPPMMYDFHLASMMPVVFINQDARPLLRISRMIDSYDVPRSSIRFSLDESHDGKSVNGSGGADNLLTYEERESLLDLVTKNRGHVKYKSSQKRAYPDMEFKKVCLESGLDYEKTAPQLFKNFPANDGILHLKDNLTGKNEIASALEISPEQFKTNMALKFFITKILEGKEPYELCIATINALPECSDPSLEVKRYLAFKTLSFALMGRHVKSVYFNDLVGLRNDYDLVLETGELRNIKRTKSDLAILEKRLNDSLSPESIIAKNMNNTIALFDSDPSFHPRGLETGVTVFPEKKEIAITYHSYLENQTVIIINTSDKIIPLNINFRDFGFAPEKDIINCLTGEILLNAPLSQSTLLNVNPYERLYLKTERIDVAEGLMVSLH